MINQKCLLLVILRRQGVLKDYSIMLSVHQAMVNADIFGALLRWVNYLIDHEPAISAAVISGTRATHRTPLARRIVTWFNTNPCRGEMITV